MSLDEIAFEYYVKKCKEVHEMWYPTARYNEKEFMENALQKWNKASDEDKEKFRKIAKKAHSSRIQTPLAVFSREKRSEIVASNPEIKPIEVMQKIEELWMNLPHSEKLKYNKSQN